MPSLDLQGPVHLWRSSLGDQAHLHPTAGLHDRDGLQELRIPLVFVHGFIEQTHEEHLDNIYLAYDFILSLFADSDRKE